MSKLTINTTGMQQIRTRMATLSRNVAESMVQGARLVVPVRTGQLQSSIEVQQRDQETYAVVANTAYAAIVERDQPYMRTALDNLPLYIIRNRGI